MIIIIVAASFAVIGTGVGVTLAFLMNHSAVSTPEMTQQTTAAQSYGSETTVPDSGAEQTTAQFSVSPDEIKYPDLGSYFSTDGGFLTMDFSLFGMELEDAARLFNSGDLFWSGNHPDFKDNYKALSIPVESPSNYGAYNNGSYIESIDMVFSDNKLVTVRYDKNGDYNTEVIETARSRYGSPSKESNEDVVWKLDGKVTYEACVRHYEGGEQDLKDFFSQQYSTMFFRSA